jgi:hypothetical protein
MYVTPGAAKSAVDLAGVSDGFARSPDTLFSRELADDDPVLAGWDDGSHART